MVILGIDPGTASMGYGVVKVGGKKLLLKGQGVIKTFPDSQMPFNPNLW